MTDDTKCALLGDHEAAKRLTESGKLLPCPFCLGTAEYEERGNEHIGLKETSIRCIRCGTKQTLKWIRLKFSFDYVRRKTFLDWNTRAHILTPEQIKKLEEEDHETDL